MVAMVMVLAAAKVDGLGLCTYAATMRIFQSVLHVLRYLSWHGQRWLVLVVVH